jgi:hypothetical protein
LKSRFQTKNFFADERGMVPSVFFVFGQRGIGVGISAGLGQPESMPIESAIQNALGILPSQLGRNMLKQLDRPQLELHGLLHRLIA